MTRGIKTKHGDTLYKSKMEAAWASVFTFFGLKYEYEPKTFTLMPDSEFDNPVKYTPDFLLTDLGYWVEVKPKNGDFDNTVKFNKCIKLSRIDKPVLFITASGSKLKSLCITIIRNGNVDSKKYKEFHLLLRDLQNDPSTLTA